MADLRSLIRVNKHAVEQKQKFLAELFRQAEELEQQKEALLKQMEEEKKLFHDADIQMRSFMFSYEESVKSRIEDIDEAREKLEKRIIRAREDLREAFANLKKIEITHARRLSEEEKERLRKEIIELDEIGIEIFRRNEDIS